MTAFQRRLRQLDQRVAADVARVGWHMTGVFPTSDEPGPYFCYTVGLFKTYGHPELITFGLNPHIAQILVQQLVDNHIKGGRTFQDGERVEGEVRDGYSMWFRSAPVDDDQYPLSTAKRFYHGTDFPALQIVMPDTQNRFPWEPGCEQRMIDIQEHYPQAQEARA